MQTLSESVELDDLDEVSEAFEFGDPLLTLKWAYQVFGEGMAMGTGFGPEGIVILDMLCKVTARPRVFYLDTGFLFDETLDLRNRLMHRYGVVFQPVYSTLTAEEQAARYGPALWMSDPDQCCNIRKVEPLGRHLRGLAAWVTSIRRDQTSDRAGTKIVSWNEKFRLVKICPLAGWTSREVWSYIREHDLPYNRLHDRGYPSIGCIQCTRPVQPGEGTRSGRWEWSSKTECGLHRP